MKTGLIVVDMQNAFCHPNGSFRKRGYSIIELDSVIETNRRLIDFAHNKSWLVIYTRLAYQPDYSDAGLLLKKHPKIRQLCAYVRGSFDSEIFEDLSLAKSDVLLTKTRYDPFIGANLEEILKQNKLKHLIVGGLLTNICVESTVRSAFDREFEVTLVSDATSTYSEELYRNSLETMKRHFADVYTFDSLVKKM